MMTLGADMNWERVLKPEIYFSEALVLLLFLLTLPNWGKSELI